MKANGSLYRIFMYILMGGFTTVINIVTFWVFATRFGIDYRIANTIAWIVAVLFAYVTNKRYVFQSHTPTGREVLREAGSFVGFRFLSYLMDLGVMIVLVSGLSVNETWSKVWTNVLVMVANYVFSKLFIFKSRSKSDHEGRYTVMTKETMDWNRMKLWIFCAAVLVFYLFLAYNTPLTHDDWTWAGSVGWGRLQNWFHDYNGRYLGNLLELFITRNSISRIILMGVFATLLTITTASMADRRRLVYYVISFVAFLGVPVSMFAQTYGWSAGFANYIPSAVLTLVFLNVVKNVFEDEQPKYKLLLTIAMIPLGICSQLFAEHVTIYNVLAAIVVIVYTYVKFKRMYLLHLVYLLSTIVGAVIMFSNGAYAVILHGHDNYRTMGATPHHASLIHKALAVYADKMYALLLMNNVLLNVLLAAFCIVVLTMSRKRQGAIIAVKNVLMFVLLAYPLYKLIIVDSMGVRFFGRYSNEFEALISVLFYLSLLVTALLFVDKKERKIKLVLYLVSVIVLAAPFLFVTPLGPRCFLASYTFFVLFLIELVSYTFDEGAFGRNLNRLFLLGAVTLALSYSYVFIMIGHASRERPGEIASQIAAHDRTITVARLPFEQFLWHGTPVLGSYQEETFKTYYGIRKNRQLNIVPYKQGRHSRHS